MPNIENFLIHGLKITNDELKKDVINLNLLVNDLTNELDSARKQITKLTKQNEVLNNTIKSYNVEKEQTKEGYNMYNYLKSFIA
jgi:hypothetical protein